MHARNPTILQLGAGRLLIHSIEILRKYGFTVHAVDRNPQAPGFLRADGHASIDICNVEAITDYARRIGADAILPVNEAGVIPAAEASAKLDLASLPPDVALRCCDKSLMRACWQAAGLPQPSYAIANTPEQITKEGGKLGYPFILKPTLNSGSRGVSLVPDEKQLPWSISFAKSNSRNGKYIVEEFISGTEITAEGLVQNGHVSILAKSDKEHQDHQNFRVAMALNYPARLSQSLLEQIDEVVTRAALALGIQNGAFHCECIVKDFEVYLIEMGGRPGGGNIFSQIVEAVSGICMPVAFANILLGKHTNLIPLRQNGACYKFFAPHAGVFKGVTGLEEARAEPGILDFGFSLEPGTVVGPIAGDADRPGHVVATGKTREEAIENANRAIKKLHYDMDASEEPRIT